MLNRNAVNKFKALVEMSTPQRNEVRSLIQEGKWRDAEPDLTRKALFNVKEKIRQSQNGKESIIGETQDWLDVSFFAEGNTIQRAVGYVTVITDRFTTSGTGFMISENLFMTNNHVIADIASARLTTVTFDKEIDQNGIPLPTTVFRLDPDKFFLTMSEDSLDYTIVALGSKMYGKFEPKDLGYFILSDAPDKHVIGMKVNIIQHPLDMVKKVTFRNNNLAFRTDNSLLYETDTEVCSSGSPVCNDNWDLVAIHHWGEPYLAKKEHPESDLPTAVNEGIRISSIYSNLSSRLDTLDEKMRPMLLEALSFAKLQPSISKKILSKSPLTIEPIKSESEIIQNTSAQNNNKTITTKTINMNNNANEFKLTIPLEIIIRIGDTGIGGIPSKTIVPEPTGLSLGAEANTIDTDYSNRSGYASDFIKGFEIPLPVIKDQSGIAPLKNTESDHEGGLLNYEHFALILNKKTRAAFFTATNIDGETYMNVNRKTGVVTPRKDMEANDAEGETWYNDDRIDPKYHLNQAFFSDWSHLFDRGHLTRRTDPSWGTKKIALRADADTFHFANCSIQHFRFNQTIPYWQGVERYVLENGVLEPGINNRLTVFQGPVYDAAIDLWADDFQIPSRFFKIVTWKSAHGLKTVALLVDQSKLLSEERRGLKPPEPVASVNVSQWRVPVTEIEKLTSLDFGKTVRDADTIGDAQPHPGAEAIVRFPVNGWDDLLMTTDRVPSK